MLVKKFTHEQIQYNASLYKNNTWLDKKLGKQTQKGVISFSGEFFNTIQSSVSSVIRQKGESLNRCNKKRKHAKFSEKRTFMKK